ncbi:hypothetical protein L3Q82_004630 [Scortum barcoo]|uniref:Uncharacterized protein n=1 Tax=Scortum barcoo TaxID=214431 RepID=A0ACB8VH29_9TELE|nr:hypothetical protein L3Q82_004630 [Scortum barcoo]
MSNFGQILKEVGEFGLFQKCLLAALCIPSVFAAFSVIGQVFRGMSFPHHCNTDWILERGPNLTDERQRNLTIPVNKDGRFESCDMFTPVDFDLETIEAYGINTTTGCIDGWDYQAPIGTSSIVTEFDVVCDKSGLVQASQSIFMGGSLIGALTFGSISDRFGRRLAILLSLLLVLLFSMGSAFSINIYVYMVFQFFCGTSGVVIVMNTSVMAVEWTNPSKTALCTETIIMFFSVGLMVLPSVAYLIPNWRILQLVLFSPLVLVLGLFYWLLPESPRWLLTQGRKEEALKELRMAARMNGRMVQEDLLDKLEVEATPERRHVLDIFRISYLRKRTLIMGYNWHNGIGLNSMCARVAGILAPLIRLLDIYHYSIPMLIYGIIPLAAGGLCLLLPETLNVDLQDHAELKKPVNGTTGKRYGADQIIEEHKQ